jgi:large subunit ribosomal protein L10
MTREEKNQIIEVLSQKLNDAPNFYFTDIGDLNSDKTSELRSMCYKNQIQLLVVKNTLLQKAMDKSEKDLSAFSDILKGPTSVMFTESGKAPAKLIREFRKKMKSEKPILKGAYIEESSYIGDNQLEILENIKTKNELIGDVIGILQSPAKNVISALQSGGQKLVGVLKTLSEKES